MSLSQTCDIYNYADDNTLAHHDQDQMHVKQILQTAATRAIIWFQRNYMQVNTSKFQSMVMNRNGIITNLPIKVGDVEIETATYVELLGMYIDCHPNLSCHVQALVSKCSMQINAIARLSRVLDTNVKRCIMNAFIL